MNIWKPYASGRGGKWISDTTVGISRVPRAPGFKHIIMKPVPDKRLGHLDAAFQSAAGLIKSSWKYEGDTWTWTFTVPEGATATVTLPGETETKDYQAGTYTVVK